MGVRGLGLGLGAALLLAGALLWWSREDARAASPAAHDNRSVSRAETELVAPAPEPSPGTSPPASAAQGHRATAAPDAPTTEPSRWRRQSCTRLR